MVRRAIVYNGVTYPSLAVMSTELGITVPAIQRVSKRFNVSLHEAIDFLLDKQKAGLSGKYGGHIFRGVWYETLDDLLKATGLSRKTYDRIRKGMSEDCTAVDIVKEYLRGGYEKESFLYQYRGKEYKTKVQLAMEYGYEVSDINKTMKRYNISFVDALDGLLVGKYKLRRNNRPRRNERSNPIVFRGVKYESLAELCRVYGISHYTLAPMLSRLPENKTPQEIIERYIQNKEKSSENAKYKFGNVVANTQEELCVKLEISFYKFKKIKRKYEIQNIKKSLEEIINEVLDDMYKVSFNGVRYKSYAEACVKLGVPYTTFNNYKRKYFNHDEVRTLNYLLRRKNNNNKTTKVGKLR